MKHSIKQSINHSNNQSIIKTINQSLKQSINPSINKTINKTHNKSINKTINKTIILQITDVSIISKGLELSTLKTQVVLWSKSKNKPSAITINGQQIEIKESAKYLGVHIDESLKSDLENPNKLCIINFRPVNKQKLPTQILQISQAISLGWVGVRKKGISKSNIGWFRGLLLLEQSG